MIDDKDIEKLIRAQKQVFVTKEEFEGLIDIVATKGELNEMEKRMEKRFDKIDEKLDDVVKLGHEMEYIENTLNIPTLKK